MKDERHPSELNPLQLYARAKKCASSTSRMSNPAWYQGALELNVQLHFYLKNEGEVDCYLHQKSLNSYEKIDGLKQRQLQMKDELSTYVEDVIENHVQGKVQSLGIVFYLSDELSIAGLGPEYQNPAEMDELRSMMIDDPTEVLDDKTVSSETHSWRLFPYSGAPAGNEFATAVAVSRKHADTLATFRQIGIERNLPIRTCALSAPLCAIASLPWFTTAKESGTIGMFNYESFTVLSFYNKHADLMMIRYMPHPGGKATPSNIGPSVMASATAFELESPEINVLSMVGNDVEDMIVSLQSSMGSSEVMMVSSEEIMNTQSLPDEMPLEILAVTSELDPEVYPMVDNATFTSFREEGWFLQDFLSPDQEELDMYPAKEDIKLLKVGRLIKMVAALVLLGVLGYAGISTWSKIGSDAWSYKKENTQATGIALSAELKKFDRLDMILRDRSKAWISMELVSAIIPADGSVILKDVKHDVRRSQTSGNATGLPFRKEWVINGFTNDKGVPHLEEISTRDGIKKLFNDVAKKTGSQAYLAEVDGRDITVKFVQRPNPTYNTVSPKNQTDNYRLSFIITISQAFTGSDEMSVANK